jgi:hypothetical protein
MAEYKAEAREKATLHWLRPFGRLSTHSHGYLDHLFTEVYHTIM